MIEVKITCLACDGKGFYEAEDFATKKTIKCKCDSCEGDKYMTAERAE